MQPRAGVDLPQHIGVEHAAQAQLLALEFGELGAVAGVRPSEPPTVQGVPRKR